MPVDHRAAVSATVTRPDDTQFTLPLKEIEPGVFEAGTVAAIPGVYKFLVRADGKTLRGISFTREQYLTAAVVYGGDNPLPTSDGDGSGKLLCCLFESLLHDPGFIRCLEERKIDVRSLLRCLKECCADKAYEPGKRATIAGTSPTASIANLTRMIASDQVLVHRHGRIVGHRDAHRQTRPQAEEEIDIEGDCQRLVRTLCAAACITFPQDRR